MRNYIENKTFNNHLLYRDVDPYNPLNLPPYTIRLRYDKGVTPTFSKGTGVQVSSSPNIWDLTYETDGWGRILYNHYRLIEVLGANTTGVTIMSEMFAECHRLTTVALFDTSNVNTLVYHMFYNCNSLNSVPLFDTSNVTGMIGMFYGCNSLTSLPLFNTSNVTNMEYMLYNCNSLNSIPLFNTSKVTRMDYMLLKCKSLTTVPLFNTSNVTNMQHMLQECTSLTTVPLFNTSNVSNTEYMFFNCKNVQSGALALYQQASTQAKPPLHHRVTFYNCGINTQTGAAELAQIPDDWKSTDYL